MFKLFVIKYAEKFYVQNDMVSKCLYNWGNPYSISPFCKNVLAPTTIFMMVSEPID